MSLFIEHQKMKWCPLCRKKWHIVEEPGKEGRAYFVCVNWKCMISIWVRDSMVGQWDRLMAADPVHCPHCRNHQMRLFCRSDGYMKLHCLNCTASIESYDKTKHGNQHGSKDIHI